MMPVSMITEIMVALTAFVVQCKITIAMAQAGASIVPQRE